MRGGWYSRAAASSSSGLGLIDQLGSDVTDRRMPHMIDPHDIVVLAGLDPR